MRETKDQKIKRLENKTITLEKEIKEIKKENKELKKENNKTKEMYNLDSDQIEQLTSLNISLKEEVTILKKQLNEIEKNNGNYKEQYLNLFDIIKQGYDENNLRLRKYIDHIEEDALEYYNMEFGYNKHNQFFFNPSTLIITINPIFGFGLCEMEQQYILNLIKDDPLYIKKFEDTKEIRETVKKDPYSYDEIQTLFQIGKELLNKLYIHLFFIKSPFPTNKVLSNY